MRIVARICLGLFLLLLLAGLLLPSVRTARPAAYRMSCASNLKQIGLALHNYKSTYSSFPPAYTVDAEGQRLHSWRTLLLPFLEHQTLYDQIDLSKPWNDPVNQAAFNTTISVYSCPAAENKAANTTVYLAILGDHQCIQVGGSSYEQSEAALKRNGVCVVELSSSRETPWMEPTDADLAMLLATLSSEQHPHVGGTNILRADGSVQFVVSSISSDDLRRLVTGTDPVDVTNNQDMTFLLSE